MNDIWLFQAFGDEVYTNSELLAAALRYRSKIIKQSRNHVKMPEIHTSYLVDPVNA